MSDKYVIDDYMYADSSWSQSPGAGLVDFGDDRFVDNGLSDADASVSWVPKTGDFSDSDWEPCDELIMKKPNTHFKENYKYAYCKEKLEEYRIDDINDDHVGVTPILDSKKRKQRRKRTNILRSRRVQCKPAIDEIVGGTTSRDEDSDSAACMSSSLRREGSGSVASASEVGGEFDGDSKGSASGTFRPEPPREMADVPTPSKPLREKTVSASPASLVPDTNATIHSVAELKLLCESRQLTSNEVLERLRTMYSPHLAMSRNTPPTDALATPISADDFKKVGLGIDCIIDRSQLKGGGLLTLFEGEILDGQLISGTQDWIDVEFKVALDSGCTEHVRAPDDVPGYVCVESPGSRVGQHFVVGDGGRITNQGRACLSLETMGETPSAIKSTFQIAKVSRPLMSVGKICAGGLFVEFTDGKAGVTDKQGRAVCTFARQPGGLYVARLRRKAPFGRPA